MPIDRVLVVVDVDDLARDYEYETLTSLACPACPACRVQQFMGIELLEFIV